MTTSLNVINFLGMGISGVSVVMVKIPTFVDEESSVSLDESAATQGIGNSSLVWSKPVSLNMVTFKPISPIFNFTCVSLLAAGGEPLCF